MEKVKTKFMCVYVKKISDFTKGKIYEGYLEGDCCIVDDNDFVYPNLNYNEFKWVTFIPLNDLYKKVQCISSLNSPFGSFSSNKYYFIDKDNYIYADNGTRFKYVENVYENIYFKTVEDYTKEEKKMEKEVSSLEKNGLVKGVGDTMVQDMFRAVKNKQNGMIQFNPVKMVNICFVKLEENGKIYAFNNPGDKRLKKGTKVRVCTVRGEKDAIVESSLKIQMKYLNNLLYVTSGKKSLKLKDIVGVYTKKTAEVLEEVKAA